MDNLSVIWKANVEYWYPAFSRLRVDFGHGLRPVCVQGALSLHLTLEEVNLLVENNRTARTPGVDWGGPQGMVMLREFLAGPLRSVHTKLTSLLAPFRGVEWFPRLGTRSPKDVLGGPRPCLSASDVIHVLLESERVYDDCEWFVEYHKKKVSEENPIGPMTIFLFPWREYMKNNELRCFVHNRRLTAISQYYKSIPFGLLHREQEVVDWVNHLLTVGGVADALPEPSCVFDVELRLPPDPILDPPKVTLRRMAVDLGSSRVKKKTEEEKEEDENDFLSLMASLDPSPPPPLPPPPPPPPLTPQLPPPPVVTDDGAYIIEINPWGKDGTTGGALFHWVDDHDVLHGVREAGSEGSVCIRVKSAQREVKERFIVPRPIL